MQFERREEQPVEWDRQDKNSYKNTTYDIAVGPRQTNVHVKNVVQEKGLPPDIQSKVASFLDPQGANVSARNIDASVKFGHANVPPGHYTGTEVDRAFQGGKRKSRKRKTRRSRRSRKTARK